MKMHNKDIAVATYDVICKKLGIISAIKFTELVRNTNCGRDLNLDHMSPAAQISLINDFWRKQLYTVPHSTEIRAWLCDGDDIDAYISAFEYNWLDDIKATGLLA